ncbi:hypothetical protein [Meiothermus taiwanensis]|uniref:O-antigen polymerase n=1 Tax=Meiothermus taiwanensis WR-220 TaxID=1339250 RepID=A0ABM6WHE4_9DEIN|nr:hypothetical protein [Meiothermus taiwanensis]AWR86209.1 hypothetical protein Mtai_v1c09650 [Meiothermus taiwanensis WR-220]
MLLTATGALVLVTAIVLFFRSSFALLLFVLVSIPFSATAVFNLQSEDGASISATLVLVIMYIFRRTLTTLLEGRIRLVGRTPLALLAVFIGALGLSLATPLLSPGITFTGVDPKGALEATFTLYFSVEHLKNLAYFLVWGLFILFATSDVTTLDRLKVVLRVLLYTGVFVSLWGWMQVILSILGMPYPFYIFNNSTNGFLQGYKQVIEELNISRMSSVSAEPSVFAAYILVLLSLLLGFLLVGVPVLDIHRDRWLALFFALTAMASTAATAYTGLLLLIFFIVVSLPYVRAKTLALFALILAALLLTSTVLAVLYWSVPLVQQVVDSVIFSRKDSFSFSQRFLSIIYALQNFADFPVLGMGINSVTVYSLPFWLLANTGVLGFFTFYMFYSSLFRAPLALLRNPGMPNWLRGLALGNLFALSLLLFITALTGFPYVFGYFWLPIFLAISQEHFLTKSKKTLGSVLAG